MPTKDPRVDAYIAKAAPFAQPILTHLRSLVHEGCPDVEETMKWSRPHFLHKGLLCGMSAFKQHCTFGFWKGELVFDGGKIKDEGMGQFGKLASVSDLPKDSVIIAYVKKAARLNEAGIKTPAPKGAKVKKPFLVPNYFTAELRKNPKALEVFDNFSYSHKKEYVEWITEAKREETRQKRIATALEWLGSGKSRNWKYERC